MKWNDIYWIFQTFLTNQKLKNSACKIISQGTVYIHELARVLEQSAAPGLTLLESGASVPNLEQQGAPRSSAQILTDLGPDSKSQ